MQTPQEIADVLNAALAGKKTQFQNTLGNWEYDRTPEDLMTSIFNKLPVRIAPEPKPPKYRPWRLDEVPLGGIIRSRNDSHRWMITGMSETGIIFYGPSSRDTSDTIFARFAMLDGQPCGVLETEEQP